MLDSIFDHRLSLINKAEWIRTAARRPTHPPKIKAQALFVERVANSTQVKSVSSG